MQKTKSPAPKKPAPKSGEPQLSRFQKFEPRRIHRRDITGAAYNPRVIDDFARAKLQKKLESRGLMNALVWNEKTGNLVSGHQRLGILDALEGSADYLLDVDVVKLTPKQEREENLFFNNRSVQGEFDVDLLGAMFAAGDLNIEQSGFETIELQDLLVDTEYASLFAPEVPEVSEELEAMHAQSNGRLENGEAIRDPERYAAVKAEHLKVREKMREHDKADDTEYMVVVVCADRPQREGLMVALGKAKDDKYIDARELAHKLKVDLSQPPPSEE